VAIVVMLLQVHLIQVEVVVLEEILVLALQDLLEII